MKSKHVHGSWLMLSVQYKYGLLKNAFISNQTHSFVNERIPGLTKAAFIGTLRKPKGESS